MACQMGTMQAVSPWREASREDVDYSSPLRRLAQLCAASQTTNLAMISTRQKILDKKNMVTQMECLPKKCVAQGVPEPVAASGGQQGYNLCEVWASG